ncbi:helix-turn-helix domain-containing protein [Acerihabitans sp.]|uniref:helix-turn-helix domain-containing protein n=1 Tax=Acerihabitans sp. TaxID=2811394 RepID=UPI002EDAA727
MIKTDIVNGVLNWLEDHLDLPLLLDDVAVKSGYSKWHLQRIFRDVTGQRLGAYIRARRLSRAAAALRAGSHTILDIALRYHFDSQQTFTRTFKRQFGITPAVYRHSACWPAKGLCPPIRLGETQLPQPDFINIPDTPLMGVTRIYPSSIERVGRFSHSDILSHFWRQYLAGADVIPPVLYGLHRLEPGITNDNERDVIRDYTLATQIGTFSQSLPKAQPCMLEGGDYAQFNYEGHIEDFQNFIILIYDTMVPLLGLTRRRGLDIERFHPRNDKAFFSQNILRCDYLIPIVKRPEVNVPRLDKA